MRNSDSDDRARLGDEPTYVTTPHLFNFLTFHELVLAMCVVFTTKAKETYNVYPIHDYATPGSEGPTDDWTELVLRAVRWLGLAHGFKFEGIRPFSDGRVTAERPICEGNSLFVALFRAGGFPDFDILYPRVIPFIQRHLPSLDVEPMRSVHRFIEEEIEWRIANIPPEQLAEIAALRIAAMSAARPLLEDAFHLDPSTSDDRLHDSSLREN